MSSRPRRPRPPAAPVEPDDGYGPSRTELRAVRVAYQARLDALTKRLCSLPPKKLDSLGLDERVVAEVRSLAGMTKGGALARQRRAVAAMLRDYDVNTIERQLARAPGSSGKSATAEPSDPRTEQWSVRLRADGDVALDAFLREFPGADRQRMRQAMRAASRAKPGADATRTLRALTALVRAAVRGATAPDDRDADPQGDDEGAP